MGHYCRICGCHRPNERFTGRGHRGHICKECQRLPKKERDKIDHENEIYGYLKQRCISKKNINRLEELAQSDLPEVAEYARLVVAIAKVKPHKKRRLKFLAREHRDLLKRLDETGLILAHYP